MEDFKYLEKFWCFQMQLFLEISPNEVVRRMEGEYMRNRGFDNLNFLERKEVLVGYEKGVFAKYLVFNKYWKIPVHVFWLFFFGFLLLPALYVIPFYKRLRLINYTVRKIISHDED
mmetsp:Transcript_34357/g.33561  ORF Transcript_34357/g.33561 Transcript_34357/m.33561 type:complete len:116 (+) Transcript_34357:267-614(+)